MNSLRALLIVVLTLSKAAGAVLADPTLSTGRQADPTAKALADIRAADKRRIPLEVQLKTDANYTAGEPVGATIIVTNLFDTPLVMNSRMLVNHPRLQGEIAFRIIGPDGQKVDIKRLITPLMLRDQDFVTLNRGESMQREVDLTDLYGITEKGTYKIQVSYHNDVDHLNGSQQAWKGSVWSDPTEIQLK